MRTKQIPEPAQCMGREQCEGTHKGLRMQREAVTSLGRLARRQKEAGAPPPSPPPVHRRQECMEPLLPCASAPGLSGTPRAAVVLSFALVGEGGAWAPYSNWPLETVSANLKRTLRVGKEDEGEGENDQGEKRNGERKQATGGGPIFGHKKVGRVVPGINRPPE